MWFVTSMCGFQNIPDNFYVNQLEQGKMVKDLAWNAIASVLLIFHQGEFSHMIT